MTIISIWYQEIYNIPIQVDVAIKLEPPTNLQFLFQNMLYNLE